ncbi:TonB-dependent receptor [Pelomonas sp. KK5]|uniref:TonB-dependent receptor n=1 Tax=Pelomonas sp. KK5 TaxID=1855730 RepID=UPI00097CB053|nr:TonB-dependent receptor [Pelomonas sp. KK5]
MAVLGAVMLSCAASAQTAPADGQAAQAGDAAPQGSADGAQSQLETVVVTANKRRQSRQEIAGTITTMSGAALEAAGIQDAEGVLRRTPGVQTNKGDPDQALPTIRGVGTVASRSGLGVQQATTGLYIEDVPFTDPIATSIVPDLAPFDLEGIDILRGPQGALYGSSSLGGAVRYTVAKPDLKRSAFSMLADAASVAGAGTNHSEYVMANLPLATDVAGLRAVLFDRRDSGYIDNTGTGVRKANELHQRGGRLVGVVKPSEGLKITGLFLTQESRVADGFATSSAGTLSYSSPTASSRDDRFNLANLKVDLDLGGYTLTSSTSVVTKNVSAMTDATLSLGDIGTVIELPALPVAYGPSLSHSRAVSQELRLASPADARLNYVVGLFYQRFKDRFNQSVKAPGGAQLLGPDLVPNDVLYTEADTDAITEKAIFADAEYRVTNDLSIGLGGRYYRNSAASTVDTHLLDAAFGAIPLADLPFDESGFTPKLNVKYRLSPAAVWYATASKGYRFGGVNYISNARYKSDSLWNYETGVHMAPSKSLSIDAAAYVVKWTDAQVNAVIGTGALSFNGIANVGKATIKGLELSAAWRPSSEFSFNLAGAWIDAATSSDFESASGVVVPSGTRLPGTAHLQTSLEGNYYFEGPADSSGRFSLSHSYMGRRTTNLDRAGELAGYAQLDARLALSWKQWELTAYVNNVANGRGSSGGTTLTTSAGIPYSVYYPIKPRTVGLSLRFDY